jgi:hypothetical protein
MRNIHAAGGSGIFSDSDSGVEVVHGRRGVDAFSDSSMEEKVSAVGDHEACPASSKDALGVEVGHARRGVDAFSDSSMEEKVSAVGDHEACPASSEDVLSDLSDGGDRGQVGMGGQVAFSDSENSENSAENEEGMPAGTGNIYSGSAAVDLFSDTSEEFSGSEMDDEVTPAGTGEVNSGSAAAGSSANPRFTAAYFTKPIPESWLVEDASDIE